VPFPGALLLFSEPSIAEALCVAGLAHGLLKAIRKKVEPFMSESRSPAFIDELLEIMPGGAAGLGSATPLRTARFSGSGLPISRSLRLRRHNKMPTCSFVA